MQNKKQLNIQGWGVIAVVALLSACSSTPPAEKEGSGTAAASNATAASATRETASAAAAAPEGAARVANATKKRTGYRVRQRNGEKVYCREEKTLGTNIPQELCYTEEQIAEIERKTDSMTEDMRQRMGTHICAPNCSN